MSTELEAAVSRMSDTLRYSCRVQVIHSERDIGGSLEMVVRLPFVPTNDTLLVFCRCCDEGVYRQDLSSPVFWDHVNQRFDLTLFSDEAGELATLVDHWREAGFTFTPWKKPPVDSAPGNDVSPREKPGS